MNAKRYAATLVCLIVTVLPRPAAASDARAEDAVGLWQINERTDLHPWMVTDGEPARVPDGPRSVRALPTITRSGQAPCCTNNLRQIALATHNYHEVPKSEFDDEALGAKAGTTRSGANQPAAPAGLAVGAGTTRQPFLGRVMGSARRTTQPGPGAPASQAEMTKSRNVASQHFMLFSAQGEPLRNPAPASGKVDAKSMPPALPHTLPSGPALRR